MFTYKQFSYRFATVKMGNALIYIVFVTVVVTIILTINYA